MPAPADPFYVIHRIKGELMRLMYLDNMRATTEQLIAGFTKMEPRYVEAHKQYVNETQQALAKGKTKKTKVDPNRIMPFSIGYADYMNGRLRTDTTNNKNNDPEWYRGYDAAHIKEPERNPQPHTHTHEEQPDA